MLCVLKKEFKMARTMFSLVLLLLVVTTLLAVCTDARDFYKLEMPEYTVLSETDGFELREYKETVWAVAQVEEISFVHATSTGFHRLFQYIEGSNMKWTKIAMTAPVLTGIVPSAGPFCSSAFAVRLYLPCQYQENPPTPLPELELTIERWPKQVFAVRQFSGYAQDINVPREAEKLAISLDSDDAVQDATYPISGGDSYAIAQYSSPFQFWNRVNEVWVSIQLRGSEDSSNEKLVFDF